MSISKHEVKKQLSNILRLVDTFLARQIKEGADKENSSASPQQPSSDIPEKNN